MNVRFLFNLLLLLLVHMCKAQPDYSNSDKNKILNPKYHYYNLTNEKENTNPHLPYDTIIFQDARYDTTFVMLAFPVIHFTNVYNNKVTPYDGFAKNISSYFNSYYSTVNSGNKTALVCYINKFSITLQYEMLEHFNSGDLRDNVGHAVNIEVECYYKHGDTLFPAVRFDTFYTDHFFGLIVNAASVTKELLQPLMRKIEQADLRRVSQRKSYTEPEIKKRYNDKFNIPILTTRSYRRGIYKSFNEFKNNNPSIDSFSVSGDKVKVNSGQITDETSLLMTILQKRNTVVFFRDKNNQLISPSEIFGYCDGNTFWIQHGAFFYQLIKVGNAFEFMYIYHYTDANKRTYTDYVLMPLNMETGHSN